MISLIIRCILLAFPSICLALPENWQLGFQESGSVLMERFVIFHDLLLTIIVYIVVFVFLLLAYTCIRYYHKNNPTPSKFTHNIGIEILWTIVPCIILVIIAVPSFKLLYYADTIEKMDMTVKIVGRQWFWQYEYPDDKIAFDSYMIPDDQLKLGQIRLLDVDNELVLPVETNIRFVITGGDVIHSFAVPAFGIKTDAVPGRINETWVRITKAGQYYGQCSELCGVGHGFMPISIKAVSKEDYKAWVETAKIKFAN
jgi:cytochrome c oxidase subunit II